jgi:hypothetical protein
MKEHKQGEGLCPSTPPKAEPLETNWIAKAPPLLGVEGAKPPAFL